MYPLYFLYDVWAVLVLRVVLGAIFVVHGWPKIKNLKHNATNFEGMGFKPGMLWGTITAFLEFFGGIGLILGVFVMTLAVLYIAQFLVIILWKWQRRMPFVGGWEFDLLILAGVFVLFSLGGGALSLGRQFMWF